MAMYSAPAGIDDAARRPEAAEAIRAGWDAKVRAFIAEARKSDLFFDQLADRSGVADPPAVGVPWNGFPQLLMNWFAAQPGDAELSANKWAERTITTSRLFEYYRKAADGSFEPIPVTYRRQDEYCEWHVDRTPQGKAVRMCFTCEPPEYWEFLASNGEAGRGLVLELYQELLKRPLQWEDISWPHDVYENSEAGLVLAYRKGDYNPRNEWNTSKGAVHLTHWANSLAAEVQLAADGTFYWPQPPGSVDPQRLICCAGYGGVNRSSDPKIGAGVYGFARQGLSVALADPIGLYMSPPNLDVRNPHGEPLAEALNVVRASADGTRILRIEVSVPDGAGFTLEECTLNGESLRYGGQIARRVTMKLFAVAKKIPGKNPTPIDRCRYTCCPFPGNPQFTGIFRSDGMACADRPDAQWANILRDVGDIGADAGGPGAFDADPAPTGRAARGKRIAGRSIVDW